jgi:hypothetical protein
MGQLLENEENRLMPKTLATPHPLGTDKKALPLRALVVIMYSLVN